MLRHVVNRCEMPNNFISVTIKGEVLWENKLCRFLEAYTRKPTGFPPGLSRSFVESETTVVPRLYSVLARPSNSSSRSPCNPSGAGDCEERGESGAGGGAIGKVFCVICGASTRALFIAKRL